MNNDEKKKTLDGRSATSIKLAASSDLAKLCYIVRCESFRWNYLEKTLCPKLRDYV